MLVSSFHRFVAKTGKRISAVFFAVLLLFLTPACDYLDARHMETVDAASIVAGVTAASVLKLTAAAFGVVIATAATAKAVDSFQEWLDENGDAQSIATWNQAQAEAQSLALNASFAGSVRDWLKSRFASLDSGEVESVTVGYQTITNGVACIHPEAEAAYLKYHNPVEGTYFYVANGSYTSNANIAFIQGSVSSDFASSVDFYFFVVFSSGLVQLYKFTSSTGRVEPYFSLSCSGFYYSYETLESGYLRGNYDYSDKPFYNSSYKWVLSCPVVFTDLSSIGFGAYFSDVLAHATATYNLDANEHFATSLGSFSDLNVSKLAALNLDAGKIAKIQSAVDQAVSTNTSEDENGNPVYTEDIAQAVIDAYNQGLEDAGAADPDVPVDPDTPVDPEIRWSLRGMGFSAFCRA